MDEADFEGSLVLEKLAEISELENFFVALDADNFSLAKALMRKAQIDAETIAWVLAQMREADGQH